MTPPEQPQEKRAEAYTMATVVAGKRRLAPRGRIARRRPHDNCIGVRMVLGCHSMKIFRWRLRGMKVSERELRAAAGDMRNQLRPRNVLRDAQDLLLKFQNDEVFSEYFANRIWAVLAMVLVFVLVSSVCSIDVMFRVGSLVSDPPLWLKPLALVVGAAVWVCGVTAQIYVFLIWLEERAAQKNRSERGIHVKVPAGVLAYLKYSRAMLPWVLIFASIVVPLAMMVRRAPVVVLLLVAVSILAPYLFKKLDR
jgi:hypothetical protein